MTEKDGTAIYSASMSAIVQATLAYFNACGQYASSSGLAAAFEAAHNPTLGLDRSICVRDLLEAADNLPVKEYNATTSARRICS